MTWIRVISFDEDETLQRARTAQQALYPVEYAEQITRDATRISRRSMIDFVRSASTIAASSRSR